MVEPGLEGVVEQSTFLRGAFEQILLDSINSAETAGACLHAAILLATILGKFEGGECLVCGGGPPMDGGLLDKAGVRRGHYWVEGRSSAGVRYVADITADQFGYEKVVVLSEAEARKRYFCGDPARIAQHVLEERSAWPVDYETV